MADPVQNSTPDWFFSTRDPTVLMAGRYLPAATTLLHRVCDNDPAKFEEATRLVSLFVAQAIKEAATDAR